MQAPRIGRNPIHTLVVGLAAVLIVSIPVLAFAQDPTGPDPGKVQQELRDRVAAQTAPRPPKNVVKGPGVQPPPPQPASLPRTPAGAGTIVESGLAPFPGALYTFVNRWYAVKGDEEIVVYAGAERNDPSQGLVVVRTTSKGIPTGKATTHRTPVKAGELRVVGAVGERLTLRSSSGETFVFDVPSRTFVAP